MTASLVTRDERTLVVEGASCRWGLIVLQFGVLLDIIYRGFVKRGVLPDWLSLVANNGDLMGLVLVSSGVMFAYQGIRGILRQPLNRQSLKLMAVVLVVLYALNKELIFTSFDPVGASVAGLHTARLDYLLLVLLALVIVIALQAVGIVLVMAMLVTPAATASLLARSFIRLMVIGAVLGALAAVAGLYISFYADLPSGPSMTLVATAEFVVVAALRKRTTA